MIFEDCDISRQFVYLSRAQRVDADFDHLGMHVVVDSVFDRVNVVLDSVLDRLYFLLHSVYFSFEVSVDMLSL